MKSKSIELLAFDKNHELQYEGECKLRIDRLSSMLLVEPKNEENKMKCALFNWNFVMDKNFIFVFGEHELSDFALVFDEERRCTKVYNFISKDKSQSDIGKEMLVNRFLSPLCDKTAEFNDTALRLKKIIMKWIDKQGKKEKKKYIQLLKDKNIFNSVYPKADSVHDNDNMSKICHTRKRRRSRIGYGEEKMDNEDIAVQQKKQKSLIIYSKCLDNNVFKLVNAKSGIGILRRLLIFTTPEKTHCYEYGWCCKRHLYFCKGCKALKRKDITTAIVNNEGAKLEEKKHVCTPIPYIQEDYVDREIIKKPDYKLLENCNTFSGKILIIFDPNDKSKCWEFRTEKQVKNCFRCCQCKAVARLMNKNTEYEYVELKYPSHACKYVPYEPKKFYQFKNFILSQDFEVQTIYRTGGLKKRLVIFDKNDRSKCYVYSFSTNIYLCNGCGIEGTRVSAKLLQNADGEDYVILSSKKHVCEGQLYSKISNSQIILRPPDFKLMENTESGVKKLFIFDSDDRSLCYVFSQKGEEKRYHCCGCSSKNNLVKSVSLPYAYLYIDENDNEKQMVYLKNVKHLCNPTKYEPQKYAKKEEAQKCYDFFFFRPKKRQSSINVAIYHSENKNLCFKLNYNKSYCYFACSMCRNKGASVITRTEKDENGKEYFKHDHKKHVCKPEKVTSICAPLYVILKRNELIFGKRIRKMPNVDDNKIIKLPDFELRPNAKGIPDASLFIFQHDDRNLGYKFYYISDHDRYICGAKRSGKCYAAAKLQIDENDEKYLILGNHEHICQPIKYEKYAQYEEQIIEASNFIIISHAKPPKINVFTTSERDQCYEFNFVKSRNYYQCIGCHAKKKYTTMKLCEDDNCQEYLRMSKSAHVCTPKKYDEPKIIPNELFELHPNTKGEVNKRLIVFTSDKKELVYEFEARSKYSYRCKLCCNMKVKRGVTVKVCEDKNGKKFLECGPQEHICQPQKYDPQKYILKEPNIISSDRFIVHNGQNGEKNKYLIIYASEKKDLAYQYNWRIDGIYYCNECRKKKVYVSAKVIENDDGTKSLKLGENEHVCQPQKYDPKKYQ